MNIETKYSPGDVVWWMRDNKPHSQDIWQVEFSAWRYETGLGPFRKPVIETRTNYTFIVQGRPYNSSDPVYESVSESELYPTLSALLASLAHQAAVTV